MYVSEYVVYRLVPSPSRYEIRQWLFHATVCSVYCCTESRLM